MAGNVIFNLLLIRILFVWTKSKVQHYQYEICQANLRPYSKSKLEL